ncbi:MAG: hypothetical protein II295_10280 [Akkermansia sp.]|nr:hypothetical protein [Akkermansia sp.]
MLKKLSVLLILALAAPMCHQAQAAQQFATYEAAQRKVTDTGYVVFIYPAGWDRYSEKVCRKLIADEAVRKAAGDAALLLAPIYQDRNEANNAKAKKVMGSLGFPGDMSDISYPAIVFYEKGGRQYATIFGRELTRGSAQQVAKLVAEKLAAKKQQDDILVKSRAATDAGEKARLLLASSRVDGIDWPGGLRNAMQQADPGDKHGYLSALNFGFGPKNGESIQDFAKRLDQVLDNDRLSPHQKQRACAAAIGHIRRSMGTMAGGELITKYARAMRKLDPKSTLGLSAPVVMRDWVRQYHYGQGWSPEVLPAGEFPMLMHGVPITQPGTYRVNFKLVTGRDGVNVKKLRLMDGSRCVATDETPRSINWGQTQQNFTLTVKKALKDPALEITYANDADKRSTWGEITISKQ